MLISLFSLLHEVQDRMKEITVTSRGSRLLRLNRNERVLQDIKGRLDEAYSDCLAASALRVEAVQMQLSVQQTQTQIGVVKVAEATDRIEVEQAELSTKQAHLAVQQRKFSVQQTQTHLNVEKIMATTDTLLPELSKVLFYSRVTVLFFGKPLKSRILAPGASAGVANGGDVAAAVQCTHSHTSVAA
ncbi:hypothetical protein B0H12DRAFT_89959 [Mycena haematopus]|nr:hypothetical protein B0H12DRAFT_89959 [Mycena haematopus]